MSKQIAFCIVYLSNFYSVCRFFDVFMFFSIFFFSSRRRHTRYIGDWSSDVCSSDLCHKTGHLACNCPMTNWCGGMLTKCADPLILALPNPRREDATCMMNSLTCCAP